MRRIVASLTLLVAVFAGSPLAADESDCTKVTRYDERGVAYEKTVCTGSGSTSSPGAPRKTYEPDELVKVVSQVNGAPCTILATRTSRQGTEGLAIEAALASVPWFGGPLSALWDVVVARLPGCAGPQAQPIEVAYSFIREIGPPDPRPHIAPGYAITGKAAFMETRGPLSHTEVRTVEPFGQITIQFRAVDFTVEWGDGTGRDKGPFTSPGEPWPEGAAKHTFTTAGRYDVVVIQRWSADWSVAGEAGTLTVTGAPSTIPQFLVREVQAVRNR